jgi:hypothetical protein
LRGETASARRPPKVPLGATRHARGTAVCVIRLYGGVTGKAREGQPMSIRRPQTLEEQRGLSNRVLSNLFGGAAKINDNAFMSPTA